MNRTSSDCRDVPKQRIVKVRLSLGASRQDSLDTKPELAGAEALQPDDLSPGAW